MTKMKKWLANLLFGIFTVLSICGFSACETNKTGTGENVNSVYGTYYPYYKDEIYYDDEAIVIKPNGVCEIVEEGVTYITGTYTQKGDVFFLDIEYELETFGEAIIANGVLQSPNGVNFLCKKGAKINEIWGCYGKRDAFDYSSQEYCKFFSNGTWSLMQPNYGFDDETSEWLVLYSGTYTIEKNGKYDISMDIDEEFKSSNLEVDVVKLYANYDNDAIELYGEVTFGEEYQFLEVGKYAKYPWEYYDNY